jgi:hypothetical protein
VRPEELYTMRPRYEADNITYGNQYASMVANGEMIPKEARPHNWLYEQLRMNYHDLWDLVPASVYYDARAVDCWGTQSHCATITDGTYRPRLALNMSMWLSYYPDDFDCRIPELVDPPIALRPVGGLNPPKIPNLQPEAAITKAAGAAQTPVQQALSAVPGQSMIVAPSPAFISQSVPYRSSLPSGAANERGRSRDPDTQSAIKGEGSSSRNSLDINHQGDESDIQEQSHNGVGVDPQS